MANVFDWQQTDIFEPEPPGLPVDALAVLFRAYPSWVTAEVLRAAMPRVFEEAS